MFAHKVLEDVQRELESKSEIKKLPAGVQGFYTKILMGYCKYIPSSHTFYFNELNDILQTDSALNKPIDFLDYFRSNIDWIRLPYPIMSFAWDSHLPPFGRKRFFALLITTGCQIVAHFAGFDFELNSFYFSFVNTRFDLKEEIVWTETCCNRDITEQIAADLLQSNAIMITTLKLLNCKNVVSETIKPDKALNKKRHKKGKLPVYEYKILKVEVPGTKKNGVANGSGDRMSRVHLCRGHFKEYTKEKPLFGRHVGLYWWQPYARGNKDMGIIDKDYAVHIK